MAHLSHTKNVLGEQVHDHGVHDFSFYKPIWKHGECRQDLNLPNWSQPYDLKLLYHAQKIAGIHIYNNMSVKCLYHTHLWQYLKKIKSARSRFDPRIFETKFRAPTNGLRNNNSSLLVTFYKQVVIEVT